MAAAVPLMELLRAGTRAPHARIERLEFFRALRRKVLPLGSWVAFLRAMRVAHDALEGEVVRSSFPALAGVWTDDMRRRRLLDADLAYFARRRLPPVPAAELRAELVAAAVRRRARRAPASLLGSLYVLEGSTLGGMVLRPLVARAFSLRGPEGLAYVSSYDGGTRAHWAELAERMNAAALDAAERRAALRAARATFGGLAAVVEVLHPVVPGALEDQVALVNPEAGRHPIADDLRELRAAIRARELAYEEFPYLDRRWGRRGRRFTDSDGAWLVALARAAQEHVNHQIAWLGGLLASRGMPRLLLARHLELLQAELARAVPERRRTHRRLLVAARMLHDERRRWIDDAALRALGAEFAARVGPVWRVRLGDVGGLLGAAVADERAGIGRAVARLEDWLVDPRRFPPRWTSAVRATLEDARALAAAGGARRRRRAVR